MKRCPNGTRRNKKTGECESQAAVQKKRCPNGSRRNSKTGECEKTKTKEPVKPVITMMQFHSKSALLKDHVLPADALRRLSNFSEDSVEFDENVYPTVEHAFQAQKYMCSNKPELVKMFYDGTLKTSLDAKSAGGKGGMKKHGAALDIGCWDKTKDSIMKTLIQSKIKRNAYIRSILNTARKHNIRFVHFSRTDMYWGAHMNPDGSIKTGLNKLGEMYNEHI